MPFRPMVIQEQREEYPLVSLKIMLRGAGFYFDVETLAESEAESEAESVVTFAMWCPSFYDEVHVSVEHIAA